MHKLLFKIGGIALLSLWSCQPEEMKLERQLQATPYFDLKGVIEEQIALLDRLNPEVVVTARIDDSTETKTIQKDSSAWAEALKLYSDADLNKPVLRDQYIVQDSILQEQNLQAKIYYAKNKEEVEIPYMKVIFKDTTTNLHSVEAIFREENPLYTTYRNMALHFENTEGNLRLVQYETKGTQKMIFKDSVVYATTGILKYY
ncbi:hypothetical protein [Catalinimonas niigatensis]|uniref:hypothetical protein n=1 Tax=Catalinimonas niigatensis TaxID=1397264 RepID=UPI00266576F7|nr:hypothetical protein [Catalinimonas niigatensis]WPP49240.1 hypothetical protein PZB72_21465 [Catalinimonas niigatensis]